MTVPVCFAIMKDNLSMSERRSREMKMINGVSMIPFGLLAGFVEQNEIRIIELAENGFRFRMSKNQKNIKNTD